MGEVLTGYLPEGVKPYDPVLAESIKGKEEQIEAKAREIINATGVVQLPRGQEGPTALIVEGDTTVQAFSASDGIVFRTVVQVVEGKGEGTGEHIGRRDFKIFYVMATREGREPIFLTFSNPVKAAVYQRLLAKASGETGSHAVDAFRQREFTRAAPGEVSDLIEKYLESQPRQDLADKHFKRLTNPHSAVPGHGWVKKLY